MPECLPGEQPFNEAELHGTVLRAVDWEEQRGVWGRAPEGEPTVKPAENELAARAG